VHDHRRHGVVRRHPSEIIALHFERPPVTPPDYEYLRKFLKDSSRLDLSSDKQYLIESRLLPVSRKAGLSGISELVQKMRGGPASITTQVVEAMTTNETFFFRDKIPFEHFRNSIMPEMLAARASRRSIRIWCAAGSTGQEPYSLAMSLKEMGAALAGWRVEILATDLSVEVIEKSKAGLYSQFEVQRGLPIRMLVKYFKQIGEFWQINADIRAMIAHRQLNLPARDLRCDLLPKRPDLFRSGHQGRHFPPPRQGVRARWLPGAGSCRNGGRADRRLQALSGTARALSPERSSGDINNDGGRRFRAEACRDGGSMT
jgi:chemotaxis methyl-accepting protein methylase